jgi:hypothetical protein
MRIIESTSKTVTLNGVPEHRAPRAEVQAIPLRLLL